MPFDLLDNNINVLYMFTLIFMFPWKQGRFRNSLLLSYLISFILSSFDFIKTGELIVIYLISLFIILEFLTDELKNKIVRKLHYRVFDYLYLMIFEYYFIHFLIVICFNSSFIINLIVSYTNNIISIESVFYITFIISTVLFIYTCNQIIILEYKTKKFGDIYNEMNRICTFNERDTKYGKLNNPIINSLLYIEDKRYLIRSKTSDILDFKYVSSKILKYFKLLMKSKNKFYDLKRMKFTLLRGYSTIEMQTIRTLGMETGYKSVYRRKFYELIYSHIYFNSLEKYYNELNAPNGYFKYYILYIYLSVAPTFYGRNIWFKNMISMFNKNIVDLNKEELFVGTLCLSDKIYKYGLDGIFNIYENEIEELGLSKSKIKEIFNKTIGLEYHKQYLASVNNVYINVIVPDQNNYLFLKLKFNDLSNEAYLLLNDILKKKYESIKIVFANNKNMKIAIDYNEYEYLIDSVLYTINQYIEITGRITETSI